MGNICTKANLWPTRDVQSFKYAYVRLYISDTLKEVYSNIFAAVDEPWLCRSVLVPTMFGNNYKLYVIYSNMAMDDLVFNMRIRGRADTDYMFYETLDRDDNSLEI